MILTKIFLTIILCLWFVRLVIAQIRELPNERSMFHPILGLVSDLVLLILVVLTLWNLGTSCETDRGSILIC